MHVMANTKPERVNAMFMLRWLLLITAGLLSPQDLLAEPEERRSFMDMRLLLVRGDIGEARSAPSTCVAVGVSLGRISGQEPVGNSKSISASHPATHPVRNNFSATDLQHGSQPLVRSFERKEQAPNLLVMTVIWRLMSSYQQESTNRYFQSQNQPESSPEKAMGSKIFGTERTGIQSTISMHVRA